MDSKHHDEVAEQWARAVVEDKKFVFHTPTGAVGRAERFFDGREEVALGVDGQPVPGPVLQVGGHTLVANPNAFFVLERHEAMFYVALGDGLSTFARNLAEEGAKMGIPPATMLVLLASALKAQAAALEAGVGRAAQQREAMG